MYFLVCFCFLGSQSRAQHPFSSDFISAILWTQRRRTTKIEEKIFCRKSTLWCKIALSCGPTVLAHHLTDTNRTGRKAAYTSIASWCDFKIFNWSYKFAMQQPIRVDCLKSTEKMQRHHWKQRMGNKKMLVCLLLKLREKMELKKKEKAGLYQTSPSPSPCFEFEGQKRLATINLLWTFSLRLEGRRIHQCSRTPSLVYCDMVTWHAGN